MISKELLSEVIGVKVTSEHIIFENILSDNIEYYTEDGIKYIDVFKLAHMCKEWAYKKGFLMQSCIIENAGKASADDIFGEYDYALEFFKANTEAEAIIKATSYIVELSKQKENK